MSTDTALPGICSTAESKSKTLKRNRPDQTPISPDTCSKFFGRNSKPTHLAPNGPSQNAPKGAGPAQTSLKEPALGVNAGDFSTMEQAFAQLKAGRPVLVLDDKTRENEGDAMLPAETASTQWLAWMIRHTSGYLCAPMPNWWADRLSLPIQVPNSTDRLHTAYTISCDAAAGVTTGISAHDRARTARVLGNPDSQPNDLVHPGHVLPLRARDEGVFTRQGHTEATVDLCRLAGLSPVGVIGELVLDDGRMMRTPDVLALGAREGLAVVTIADLIAYRNRVDRVRLDVQTTLPTDFGDFRLFAFTDLRTGADHVALVADGPECWVRVHSQCLTGDVFGSRRCDCGQQLHQSMRQVAERGGVVIYLGGQEGRGVGLINKLRAYVEQDAGADTVDAQKHLGLPVDAREYGAAGAILTALGCENVQLMTNNPDKIEGLVVSGISVTRVPIVIQPTPEDAAYLETKRTRMGHLLPAVSEMALGGSTPAASFRAGTGDTGGTAPAPAMATATATATVTVTADKTPADLAVARID